MALLALVLDLHSLLDKALMFHDLLACHHELGWQLWLLFTVLLQLILLLGDNLEEVVGGLHLLHATDWNADEMRVLDLGANGHGEEVLHGFVWLLVTSQLGLLWLQVVLEVVFYKVIKFRVIVTSRRLLILLLHLAELPLQIQAVLRGVGLAGW